MSEIQKNVLNWLATGRVGSSSQTMAFAACELPARTSYPMDGSDLQRCLKLLEAVPEVRLHFNKVAAVSPVWARLIASWEEIEMSFLTEAGLDWEYSNQAPNTYALLKKVIGDDPSTVRFGNATFHL